MTQHNSRSKDETEILALIERWAQAVRNQDRATIREAHDADMLMFDVPPPFLSRGLDAYMATWEPFFSMAEKPVAFHFHDIEITAGEDVAFATAFGKSCRPRRSLVAGASTPRLRSAAQRPVRF